MESIRIEMIGDMFHRINVERLIHTLDQYALHIGNIKDARNGVTISTHFVKTCEHHHEELEKLLALNLSLSSMALFRVIHFKPEMKRETEKARSCNQYFKDIRKHHIELLRSISENLEIMKNGLRQFKMMRTALLVHFNTVDHTAEMITLMGERIRRRPGAVVAWSGIPRELNRLPESAKLIEYRPCAEDSVHTAHHHHASSGPFYGCYTLLDETMGDIKKRCRGIETDMAELKFGYKLYRKLAEYKFSRSMKDPIERLIRKHEERTAEFRKAVAETRRDQLFTAKNVQGSA